MTENCTNCGRAVKGYPCRGCGYGGLVGGSYMEIESATTPAIDFLANPNGISYTYGGDYNSTVVL